MIIIITCVYIIFFILQFIFRVLYLFVIGLSIMKGNVLKVTDSEPLPSYTQESWRV